MTRPLIGSVLERNAQSSKTPPKSTTPTPTPNGFPAVTHRSKSAFARAREARNAAVSANATGGSTRPQSIPAVLPSASPASGPSTPLSSTQPPHAFQPGPSQIQDQNTNESTMLRQIDEENAQRVAAMSDAEREREKEEVMERFGSGIGDLLKRIRETRERRVKEEGTNGMSNNAEATSAMDVDSNGDEDDVRSNMSDPNIEVPLVGTRPRSRSVENLSIKVSPPPILSTSSTRPSTPSRPNRRLRFAQVAPDDVHVYDSAPASPKARRAALALPPPPDEPDDNIISLGTFKGSISKPIWSSDPFSKAVDDAGAGDGDERRTSPMEVDAAPFSSDEPSKPSILPSSSDPPPPALEDPLEEGTPEDIRRRFFPHLQPDEPSLAWIQSSLSSSSPSTGLPSSSTQDPDEPRFDLNGSIIPPSETSTLPSHLGLHHHADTQGRAGYTLDDMFLLARSTVPSQRTTMLTVLSRIARRLARTRSSKSSEGEASKDAGAGIPELSGKEEDLRSRILAAGLGALGERGGVGIAAIDVVWACLPGWHRPSDGANRDLQSVAISIPISYAFSVALLKSVQPAQFLAQVAALLSRPRGSIPPESASQLLDVLRFLARESTQLAEEIVKTPGLVNAVVGLFLLTPMSTSGQSDGGPGADSNALGLLEELVQASRGNARTISEGADGLLRFVVSAVPLEVSDVEDPLKSNRSAKELLVGTLKVYTALAAYGLHASVATTAQAYFSALSARISSSPIFSSTSTSASGSTQGSSNLVLATTWARLVEAWTTCAIDPHMTSPPHEILWSQVAGWGWGENMCALGAKLARPASAEAAAAASSADFGNSSSGSGAREDADAACAAAWNAASAWLEGARVNGVRGGEAERAQAFGVVRPLFGGSGSDGAGVVWRAAEGMRRDLDELSGTEANRAEFGVLLVRLGKKAEVLGAATRLFLACVPAGVQPATLTQPPFALPFEEVSALCGALVTHPLWDGFASPLPSSSPLSASPSTGEITSQSPKKSLPALPPTTRAFIRPLSTLLAYFIQLSRLVPSTPPDLWLAQALAVLSRLGSGDEGFATWIVEKVSEMMTPRFLSSLGVPVPATVESEEVGRASVSHVEVLKPFLTHTVRPLAIPVSVAGEDGEENITVEEEETTYIAPAHPTPESIRRCTTLRLPSAYPFASSSAQSQGPGGIPAGLPLARDWLLSPIDHLLRSGTSPVFASADFPASWNGSEISVVRASLTLALAAREALVRHGLAQKFAMGREEAVFGCMRVFMLEHGQPGGIGGGVGGEGGGEEVFRDKGVDELMRAVLAPYRYGAAPNALFLRYESDAQHAGAETRRGDLEEVSRRFLGAGTPFFQFYTDFLALYDAISFAHPTFGVLLLPPTASSSSSSHQGYSSDYRKLLYSDYAHVLRTLRTPVSDVLGDPREWLWPLENEQAIVHAYLQALTGGKPLQGLVRLVAVHHVAGNIWPDMRPTYAGTGEVQTGASAKLLRAVVEQCDNATVREVLCYRQERDGGFVPPPACFSLDDATRARRIGFIGEMLGDGVRERLEGVFREEPRFA